VALVSFLVLLSATAQRAGAEEFTRGQVIERVVCKADSGQAYALYLPSGYTAEKRWPILYAFDPSAQGLVPVELFREAAEKYGWIVVGSLNSRNGPMKVSIDASNALWNDTHARFSIDDRRIYTTGFSGGARVAVWVAYLCNGCAAGVIACGAGFHTQIAPTAKTQASAIPFAFFATVGTDDFNFGELKQLDDVLNVIGLPHRTVVFEGGHMWAPKELCTRALAWMELEAIRSGRKARDEALIAALWAKELERVRALEEAKKLYDAYTEYQAIVADFRAFRDVTEFERKLAQLRELPSVKQALREEKEQIKRQQDLTRELLAFQERRRDIEARTTAYGDFKRVLDELRRQAREPADSIARRVARRTLHDVFAFYYEGAGNLIQRRKDLPLAVANLEIAALIAENNPQVFYELATAYALNGEKKKALEALRRAVLKGFKDLAQLQGSQALEPLRKEAEYREILESLSPKP
jgi:poly(3-hydroxybutyrate) depolymerase